MFVISIDHEGCDIEFCFFIAQSTKSEDKTQLIFTTNYFNPLLTETLVMKLAAAEAEHAFVELVGFIGKFSDDNYAKVERGVEVVFEIFCKRLDEMARNMRHKGDIHDFISDPVQQLRKKAGPIPVTKASSERWSLRTRNKPAVVDLTFEEKDDNAAFVLTDEVSESSLYEYACSEILELPEQDDYFDAEIVGFAEGWDEQIHPKWFGKKLFDLELFDNWLSWVQEHQHEAFYEDGFKELTLSNEKPSPAKPRKIPDDDSRSVTPEKPEVPETPKSAIEYYEQKAAGSSTGQRRPIPVTRPKLARGLDSSQSIELEAVPRKSRSTLFTDEEMENLPKKPKYSIVRSLNEKTPACDQQLGTERKIPKKQDNSSSQEGWKPRKSIISKSPYSRNSIHSNTQSKFMTDSITIFKPSRTEKALQHLKMPFASPTLPPDVRPSKMPKFDSKKSPDDDDVILVDDEAENEPKANDQNNNQKPNRRRLYTAPPEPEAHEKSYKFFKSKQEPDFKRHDGTKK